MSDANLLIDKLKKANQKKSLDIFLPTLGKKVKFAPLTLKQQKELLSKVPETTYDIVQFNNIFNSIIVSNNEEEVKLSDLKNIDKFAIVLQYKINMTGSTYKVGKKTVSLNQLLEKINEYDYSIFKKIESVSLDNLSAELEVPNLEYDAKINKSVTALIKNKNKNNAMAELFLSEFIKYVKSITLDDDKFNLSSLSYDNKLTIIEELPTSFTKKIIDYMDVIKTEENELSTINGVTVDITNDLFA